MNETYFLLIEALVKRQLVARLAVRNTFTNTLIINAVNSGNITALMAVVDWEQM